MVSKLIILLQICQAAYGYEFVCPDNSHRRIYSKTVCGTYGNYACLKDVIENRYREMCYRSRPIGIGYKYVFRPGFDREICDLPRYQPFRFRRKDLTDCVFQKSKCSEQGQTIDSRGFSSTDVRCKCNEAKGYKFVTIPIHKHFCIPSEEDCTCYRLNISLPQEQHGSDFDYVGDVCILKQARNIMLDNTKYNINWLGQNRREAANKQIIKLIILSIFLTALSLLVLWIIMTKRLQRRREAANKLIVKLTMFLIVFTALSLLVLWKPKTKQPSLNGRKMVVKELVHRSEEINKSLYDGKLLLHIACQENNINLVNELLLSTDINIDQSDEDGRTSLYIACEMGFLNIVQTLSHNSADINKSNKKGTSPLYIASQKGHTLIVRTLIEHSADINKNTHNRKSPLTIACYYNHVDVVKELLLSEQININQTDQDGCTSLYLACQQGHLNVVQTLIQHSADINKCNNKGVSPLSIARENGHTMIVKQLMHQQNLE